MNEYEVLIESINPCGGESHAKKEFLEIEAESPEAYVMANAQWPVISQTTAGNGDIIITTGDGHGNLTKYTFTE